MEELSIRSVAPVFSTPPRKFESAATPYATATRVYWNDAPTESRATRVLRRSTESAAPKNMPTMPSRRWLRRTRTVGDWYVYTPYTFALANSESTKALRTRFITRPEPLLSVIVSPTDTTESAAVLSAPP